MNNISLIGRLTADPDFKNVGEKKTAICTYTLAVRRPYAQEGAQDCDFINCTEFGRAAEFAVDHFVKGQQIGVIGHLNIDKVTNKDGENRYYTKVIVTEHFFADAAPRAEEPEKPDKPASRYQRRR